MSLKTLVSSSLLFALVACGGGQAREPVAPTPEPEALPSTPAPATPPAPPASASAEVPPDAAPAKDDSQAGAASKRDHEAPEAEKAKPAGVEGTLASKNGATVVVKVRDPIDLPVGTSVELTRFFDGKDGAASPLGAMGLLFGGANVSGWVTIADARIAKVGSGTVTLKVVKERSTMKINGKPVNHFTTGARVKVAVADGTQKD